MRLCRVFVILLSVFAVAVVSLPTARAGVVWQDEDEHEERDADEAVKSGAKLQLPNRERDRHPPRLAGAASRAALPFGKSAGRRPGPPRAGPGHVRLSVHLCTRLLI